MVFFVISNTFLDVLKLYIFRRKILDTLEDVVGKFENCWKTQHALFFKESNLVPYLKYSKLVLSFSCASINIEYPL
jgi:hypothetical protein